MYVNYNASIGTDTKFPEHIAIPEVLKVPDGNAFKFVLYGIGLIVYKFDESESTWKLFKAEEFFYNSSQDVSFSPNSMVATFAGSELDKLPEGSIKSTIPGDTSFVAAKPVVRDLDPKLNTLIGSLGQTVGSDGAAFSDVTYILNLLSGTEYNPPEGSHPDGYTCRIPYSATHLFYKSA